MGCCVCLLSYELGRETSGGKPPPPGMLQGADSTGLLYALALQARGSAF